MTRDQAVEKLRMMPRTLQREPEFYVDALIALDILKVEEVVPVRRQAMGIAADFVKSNRDLQEMFHNFDLAGLEIVKK